MFTEDQIKELERTANPYIARGKDIWIKAFNFYNSKNKKQLTMNCTPCYFKVLKYIKEHGRN